jgi:hypothetical protein
MGHWGKGIYDSDQALDYLSTITDQIEREIAYWTSPEQVHAESWWLAQVLTVIEVMLLLEDKGSMAYMHDEAAVWRWREVFLSAWDGDWDDSGASYHEPYPYARPDYRQQHRAAIIALFDRLEGIARGWGNLEKGMRDTPLTTLLHDYSLPYFSIHRWKTRDNRDALTIERFVVDLIHHVARDIVYLLSPDMRPEVLAFNVYEMGAAVDVLALLCARYDQSPGFKLTVIRGWRAATTEIWKAFNTSDKLPWDEADPLHQNVMQAFDRLEAVAAQYPAFDW